MKDELQNKLVEVLDGVQRAAGAAGDFAIEQLPDIAQSYVAYGRAVSVFEVVACIGAILATIFVLRATDKNVKAGEWDAVVWIPAGFVFIPVVLVSVAGLFTSVSNAMLVWFAPKVWLLKQLAALVK